MKRMNQYALMIVSLILYNTANASTLKEYVDPSETCLVEMEKTKNGERYRLQVARQDKPDYHAEVFIANNGEIQTSFDRFCELNPTYSDTKIDIYERKGLTFILCIQDSKSDEKKIEQSFNVVRSLETNNVKALSSHYKNQRTGEEFSVVCGNLEEVH